MPKRKYTSAQKDEAFRLLAMGEFTLPEIEQETGIKTNTLKAMKRNKRISNQTLNGAEVDEKVEDTITGNKRVVNVVSKRVITIDDLIEVCGIDLNDWHIDKIKPNKWETAGKFGATGEEYFEVQQLFQITAWLTCIHPEAIKPVVSPVQVNVSVPKIDKPKKSKLKKSLLIGDAQIGFLRNMRSGKLTPFHDRKAIDIGFQLLQKYQFDEIIIGGDWLDFSMWSKTFLKKPAFYFTTQPALVECSWILANIRQLQPNAEICYLEGNHEVRPEQRIMEHFVDAYGLRTSDDIDGQAVMSIPNLLGLDQLDIQYVGNYPADEKWLNEKVVIRHGDTARKGSGSTVTAIGKEAHHSEIIFHIHRRERVSKTLHNGHGAETIEVICPGSVCRIDGTVPGKTARPNWQQGIGIAYYDGDRFFDYEQIAIEQGKALYRDELFTGKDYAPQLKKDTTHHDKTGELVEWNY